jgi:hypothetical protein
MHVETDINVVMLGDNVLVHKAITTCAAVSISYNELHLVACWVSLLLLLTWICLTRGYYI